MLSGVRILGIDLHWYLHSYSALELAREVKSINKDIKIVLGGYTASIFSSEVLRDFPDVDHVICGEGEVPVVEYAKAILQGSDLAEVPNLAYRRGNEIVRNQKHWVASPNELNDLVFSRLDLLSHYELYLQMCMRSPVVNYTNTPQPVDHLFYLPVGRGCVFECPYCGGSRPSTKSISQRMGYTFRSPEKVLADIKGLAAYGVNNFFMGSPITGSGRDFYLRLFQGLQDTGLKIGLSLEAWSLPDEGFLKEMARATRLEHSGICISPGSGSEQYRRQAKDGRPFYSHQSLLGWLALAKQHGILPCVALTMGLPHETLEHFRETKSLTQELVAAGVSTAIMACKVDPGSDLALNPSRHGVVCFRNTFSDFYRHSRALSLGEAQSHPLGYRTKNFSEKEILKMQIQLLRIGYLNWSAVAKKRGRRPLQSWRAVLSALGIVLGVPRLLNLGMRE